MTILIFVDSDTPSRVMRDHTNTQNIERPNFRTSVTGIMSACTVDATRQKMTASGATSVEPLFDGMEYYKRHVNSAPYRYDMRARLIRTFNISIPYCKRRKTFLRTAK